MSKLNRKEFKELLTEWNRNFISESNRVIMSDPKDFVGDDGGLQSSRVQNRLMTKEIEDMSYLSVEDTLRKLISIVDENTFIHFLTGIDKRKEHSSLDVINTTFSVNPNVKWGDQQGIFSYKLDKQGLVNLIQQGRPASGGYGTGANFFQVFKIDDARSIEIFEKEGSVDVKLPSSLLPISNNTLENNLEELVRQSFNLIKNKKNINLPAYSTLSTFDGIKQLYIEAIESNNVNYYILEIMQSIDKKAKKYLLTYGQNNSQYNYYLKNSKAKYFILLKAYIKIISRIVSIINNTTDAQYGSLLWHLLGVENINDKGVGLIHGNEKSQAVSFDFSGESLTPIGTFRNYFKEKPLGQHYSVFIDIITEENLNWDFDIVTEKFNEISDPRDYDLEYTKKMLKIYDPKEINTNADIWYFWCDSMEGALWAFSEHSKGDEYGLLLLNYIKDNVPELNDYAIKYIDIIEKREVS